MHTQAARKVDIIDYLSVDGDGRIQRGAWHEVQIVPNGLTRIEAALQSVLFVNPRGGEIYNGTGNYVSGGCQQPGNAAGIGNQQLADNHYR